MTKTKIQILKISNPSELFDCDNPKAKFRQLVQEFHPDAGGTEEEFVHLKELWEKHLTGQEVQMKDFWKVDGFLVASHAFERGERANYYKVHNPDKPHQRLALRVPRNGIDSGNAEKIIKVTSQVANCSDEYDFSAFMPRPHKVLNIDLGNQTKRKSLLIQRMSGWATLKAVRRETTLHILDSAWIIRRLMAIAGAFREAGLTHGNLNFNHVLIEPNAHGLAVCGLSDAKFILAPQVDALAVSQLALEITDHQTLPRQMAIFLRNLDLKPVPHMWELRQDFDEMLMKATGDRLRFREFEHDVTTIE